LDVAIAQAIANVQDRFDPVSHLQSAALSNLTNGPYLLTYWQKSAGVWSLQSQNVTVSSGTYTISLTGQLDEVRFYPAGARLTTYTFDPLIV